MIFLTKILKPRKGSNNCFGLQLGVIRGKEHTELTPKDCPCLESEIIVISPNVSLKTGLVLC